MARYFNRKIIARRTVVTNRAIASLSAAISAFQYLAPLVQIGAFQTGFAAMSRGQSVLRERSFVDDVYNREIQHRSRQSRALARGLFDPLFSGLSADAARIDAAISRRMPLR